MPYRGDFPLALANVEDIAHLDVAAHGFWGSCHQKRMVDSKVEAYN